MWSAGATRLPKTYKGPWSGCFFSTWLINGPIFQKILPLKCVKTSLKLGTQAPTLVSILRSLRSVRARGTALGVGAHPRIQRATRWRVRGHGGSGLRRSKLGAGLVPLHVGHESWENTNKQAIKSTLEKPRGCFSCECTCSVKSNVDWGAECG